METVYDWVTMALFAGLITLFLQRSSMDEPPDEVWHYLAPAVGCAAANFAGNKGYPIIAIAIMIAAVAYVVVVLKPFGALKR